MKTKQLLCVLLSLGLFSQTSQTATTIAFDLKEPSDWSLVIYNLMGQEVRTYSGHDGATRVSVTWDGTDASGHQLASGIYLYRFNASTFTATRKMTLIK